jgi:penicillin-binding protein 2
MLGVDLPHEKSGFVPTPQLYDRMYEGQGAWRSTYLLSVGIGQGELSLTTLQMANLAAIIANRGFYYTPHLLKAIAGPSHKSPPHLTVERHRVPIDLEFFDPVILGMEKAISAGTATAANIPGITVCGKTGTSENPHGADHSVFYAFAPKDNPKIAIAVYIENAGWGGVYAAPIASLMIERFLAGEIGVTRQWLEAKMLNLNLLTSS